MPATTLPGHTTAIRPPEHAPDIAIQLDTDVKLTSGTLNMSSGQWQDEPQEHGFKLVLVQQGRLRCRIPGQPEHHLQGPGLCLIAHEREYTVQVAYEPTAPLRYTIVQLGPELFEHDSDLLPPALKPQRSGPRLLSRPAHPGLQTLAAQMATCSWQGATRRFYLGGKALELAALGMQLVRESPSTPAAPRITLNDVERIHAARDVLFSNLQHPPTLNALAAHVGTNPRKLSAGFQQVFGTSAFALLAEQRLRQAHRMLCDEDVSIAAIADRVGYTPAHFSMAFRARYGIPPRALRARNR